MTLTQLLVFGAAALLFGWIFKERWRGWLMLIGSLLALYWLQPATPIRHLDFWLPTASLALTVLVWAITRPPTTDDTRPTLITGTLITALVIAIGLTRYLGPLCCLIPTRPPDLPEVLIALVVVAALAAAVFRFAPGRRWLLTISAAAIIALFMTLKTEPFALAASAGMRALGGQSAEQASALDVRWLGFSYIAFRLLHALRDRVTGRLPALSLQEFVTYALFFPSLTAGPIDRAERFAKDLRQPFALSAAEAMDGLTRIVAGVFKKFVLADTLAAIALNGANAAQTTSTLWMWVLLYAYAFRLYLDFGGYTDIAIGIGRLCGVRLPENFDRPYLKQNLTAFWNGWHITLAQWFRAYFFNPLTRALRSAPSPQVPEAERKGLPPALIIFVGQAGTMILIGLWHGVTWNFVAWGAWHGLGLFVHNRWTDFTKPRATMLDTRPVLKRAAAWGGALLTFHYVVLGWVWFALPEIGLAGRVMRRLFGA